MSLWPSKKQWRSWSLPSKLTAISVLLGIVALCLWGIDKVTDLMKDTASKADVEAIVKQFAQEYKAELEKQYPAAHTVFGITHDGFVVPKGHVPTTVKVFWDTGKVYNLSDNAVRIRLPDIKPYEGMLISGTIIDLVRKVGAKSGRLISVGGVSPIVEIIGIQGDLVIAALSFEAKNTN
ncbi:hypothetical protein MYX65_08290 [Acidobacteria bacterium AH-259-L09]|nr:hypothetical protein [Acidobacteria bacterium AH-259-L09]